MIKVAISGIRGRMGASIYNCLAEDGRLHLTCATDIKEEVIGNQVKQILQGESHVVIARELTTDFDVLIDFTSIANTLANLAFCKANNKAIVIGTTGFSETELAQIADYAKDIPVFISANMSVGVNLMQHLVATAAKALYTQADIEIVEAHHKHKIDAPSGTAMMMGKSIAKALDIDLAEKGVFAREGITGEREAGSIGFSTVRGGDVVGDHRVHYFMQGERLEISHQATDRKIFARGALFAAGYLVDKPAGLYNMSEALGLERGI